MLGLPRPSRGLLLVATAAFCGLTLPSRAHAQSLETFVLTAGGDSSGVGTGCTTYTPPPPAFPYFGSANIYIPIAGLSACGIAGSWRWTPATVGPARDTMTLAASWPGASVMTDTKVSAQYRVLTAAAHSTFAGNSTFASVTGSSGFAAFHDVFTITSPAVPAGQTGWIRVWVRVTGGLSCTGPGRGTVDVAMNYRLGSQPLGFLFRGGTQNPSSPPAFFSVTGKGVSGFAVAPGVANGTGDVDTLPATFTFGTPVDFSLVLQTYTLPVLTSTTSVGFRAWVSSIDVLDANQRPVPFTLTAASGVSYTSQSVDTPKEPPPEIWPIAPVLLQKLGVLGQ